MVVVVIIALLVSVIVVSINRARLRTRDTIIISQVEQVKALAETVYNPEEGYEGLKDHPSVEDIERKVVEMGLDFYLKHYGNFVGVSDDDWSRYCSYAELASDNRTVVCVDWKGNKIIEEAGKVNCTDDADGGPNCEHED